MSKEYGAVRLSYVVAVVVFLIAVWFVLFPMFTTRGDGGRWPSSMNSLKLLGLASMQYTQDYDERVPGRQYGNGASIYSWRIALEPYLKAHNSPKTADDDIFAATDDAAGNLPDIEGDGFHRSFAVNSTTGLSTTGPYSDTFAGDLTLAKIDTPANTISFVESTAAYNDFSVLKPAQFTSVTNGHYAAGHLFARKLADATMFTNIGFADGHAKSVEPMSTLGDAIRPGQWGIDNRPMSAAELTAATNVIAYGIANSDADWQLPTRERTFWQKLTGKTR